MSENSEGGPQIPSAAAKQGNGALLLHARRRPGGGLPFPPRLRRPPPAAPLPASGCRGSVPARPAVAPRPPLSLRLVPFLVAPAAAGGAPRGDRRLRGTAASSVLLLLGLGLVFVLVAYYPATPLDLLCLLLHVGKIKLECLTEPVLPQTLGQYACNPSCTRILVVRIVWHLGPVC